ncbi:ETS translocation variant 1 [Neolamprologus brichardi]|uniref:ETS translocation variant 1 n=1 Tax=Neolamprologus brichardi TaxID=32507 RepID=UPI0016437987|nr:ETS translocation variant 1 [Neolamprologus brichardi]
MDGFHDQQVPYYNSRLQEKTTSCERPANDRKRKFIKSDLALDSEELFQDLSQLQETWLAEAQVPDNDEQFVPDFQTENLAFHGLQLKIKRELHSPCSELSSNCSQERPFKLQYGEKCPYSISAYEQKQPTGMKPSSPVTPPCSTPVSPLHHGSPTAAPTPKPDRTYTHIPPSQPLPDNAYTMDHRFRRQLSEPCHSFPSPPTMARDGRPIYHRQMSEPNIPFPPQGFKQEYPDPLFEHPAMMGAPIPHTYPAGMMIKQEPRDFTYDSAEVPSCHSVYLRQDGYLAHTNRTEGCMFDKVARHFYDDTCVVPEKVEGDIKQESGLYREGPSYQRRGSLQLWQFLVALLDDPSNSHFIAWTGRGMEFKLIEPEEDCALLWARHENRALLECYYASNPGGRGYMNRMRDLWILRYPTSTMTAKQLVAQCSNIRKKGLLSQLEIDEVQHKCYGKGEPGQGGDIITPTRDWVPSLKCDRRRIVECEKNLPEI